MSEDTSKTTHWQCPGCGGLLPDEKYRSATVDLQCMVCHSHKWSTFRSVHIIGTSDGKIGE